MITNTLLNHRTGCKARTGRWLAAALLLLTGPAAFAQLSGAYTINSAQPTGGTNYASFTAAAAALNTSGVSGPVTFTVSGGPYTEQISLNPLAGSSATNRVTFNGGGRTIQFGSSTSAQRGVITLSGADYVTLNNLVVDATEGGISTATYGWGIHVLNNADNNVISNCVVTTNNASTSSNFAGIVSSASTTGAATTGATASQNLTITGNTVTGGYYGIAAVGSGTVATPTTGITISNNTVRDFYIYGIYVSYLGGAQLIGNDVARPTRTTVSTFYGLYLTTGTSGAAVEKNRLHNPFGAASSTSTFYGVYLTTGTAATAQAASNDVVNNLVYDVTGGGGHYGLYNGSSGNSHFYHNSVSLDDQTSTGASDSYGFYQTTGLGVEFRNNMVSVTRTGTGSSYDIYLSSATGTTVSNNNDLYGSGTDFNTGYYPSASYATLANWRTANGGMFDQNSTAAAPEFVSPATGNLQPTAGSLNGTAAPLARVPQDVTGATRSTTAPDMGAYEFTPASNDVALVSIDSPVSPVLAGARTVTVTIANNGATLLNTVQLAYTLNGGAAVTQNFTLAGGLVGGASRALSFTVPATLLVGANTLSVTASLPNGSADANANNNTQAVTLYTAMAGTYTINKSLPTGGTNFASFSDAGTALTAAGISASVRFNVLNGPYTEQFALGVISGVSATDTVVIDGGASKQTLSYTGTVSQPAAVLLNGSDFVTLQNLTIDASAGATYGIGVHLVGSANNNRVASCVVMAPATATSSTANSGIAASGSLASASTAGDANGLRLENNVISGGYYGVILTGTSTTARAAGLRVSGNEIRDFYIYGLDVENTTGARLLGNNIHRTSRPAITTFYGLYFIGNVGAAVERNRIHDTSTGNTASTSVAYGMYFSADDGTAGNESDVVNNVLYNFNGAGTEYGFYNTSSDYVRYYHNTISLDNQATAATTSSYGFYQTTLATGLEFRNNVVSVTRTGSGTRFALYYVTTTSSIASNHNDLYAGPSATAYTGRYGTVNYATLADWRAANANAFDQNSLPADPRFVAATTGNLEPMNVTLNGAGTVATIVRVPRDIANVLRTSPPDLGAYEFTPVANDVAVVSIDSPTSPATPGANAVTVTIRNGGTAVLTSVALSYALNGGTPTPPQVFSGLSLAPGAAQQLSFGQGVVVPSGTNTLAVTGSLPNGQPDGNATNNTQTITFTQPTPDNDEPCTAVALGTAPLTSSTSGASTTVQPTIITPACSPASLPKDVWFTFTPSGTSTTLTLTGAPAGMVRIFSTPNCAAGPFTQVFCQGSGTANTAVGTVAVAGLTAGTRYYVAVSGYGSADLGGQFTIAATALLASRAQVNSAALAVYPNPSATGQLALQVARPLGLGTVELLNTLGQVVLRQPLAATTAEQTVRTTGLAAGFYTLRVQGGGEVLTRKVVLQ